VFRRRYHLEESSGKLELKKESAQKDKGKQGCKVERGGVKSGSCPSSDTVCLFSVYSRDAVGDGTNLLRIGGRAADIGKQEASKARGGCKQHWPNQFPCFFNFSIARRLFIVDHWLRSRRG
jgi:hypothetical protein